MELLFFVSLYFISSVLSLFQIRTSSASIIPKTKNPSFYSNVLHAASSSEVDKIDSSHTENLIKRYHDELVSLRGKPELVDRLENLARNHPGIELDIELYRLIYPFPLDDFQIEGLLGLINGKNMIVSTPTGSGKTIVGELAIYFALMMGLKVVYTTPLKALSNQKFQDFTQRYGGDRVGLLTGDVVINRGAAVTIMTTEVFRNMVYDADSYNQLSNLFMVCFDEFHYMNDPERGTVWEESVISCPSFIRILALSATMGNVDDIKGWLSSIHGPTELVLSNHRPVPLRYLFAVKKSLLPLFRDPNAGPGALNGVKKVSISTIANENTNTNKEINSAASQMSTPVLSGGERYDASVAINPSILKLEEQAVQNSQIRITKSGRPLKQQKFNQNTLIPKYHEVISDLHNLKLLPAIIFIFSRVGCDDSAKQLLSHKLNLLTKEESDYVTLAINNFAKLHPEIPIAKSSVQILKHGVGVHHAGLIPVWKGFIETLFNENKIKVLFATETLAAGVNMPARTTVISSVTKRISSEIIKLKTSQLLQMAGRAGRRGKDESGTVIIMRNRFEDVKMGHKILISPTDGIKSHFRTSYGLTVKLMESRTFDECKTLVEKGFGSYLLQKKLAVKYGPGSVSAMGTSNMSSTVTVTPLDDAVIQREMHRTILQKYTLKVAREYFKLFRKLEKERNNEMYLMNKWQENDDDLVHAIVEYMPLGAGVLLHNNVTGYFLGDVKWGDNNIYVGFGVIIKNPNVIIKNKGNKKTNDENVYGTICVVKKEHIKSFFEPEDAIPGRYAKDMLDVLSLITIWNEINFDDFLLQNIIPSNTDNSKIDINTETLKSKSKRSPILIGIITGEIIRNQDKIEKALEFVNQSPSFPVPKLPGSIIRQQQLIHEIHNEYKSHPIVINNDQEKIINALRYVSQLKDPIGFVSDKPALINDTKDKKSISDTKSEKEVYAWTMFINVLKILQFYNAVDKEFKPTQLGRFVGSFSGDNELWVALALQNENMKLLNAPELAAVMCALTTDGYKARNAFFKYEPSNKVKDMYVELEQLSWDLKDVQNEYKVDFPVHLCTEMGGLVESWVSGLSWRELCQDTNMDQGDLCRTFRRTVELLKQIPSAFDIDRQVADAAAEAVRKMNRFPVADYNDVIDASVIMSPSNTTPSNDDDNDNENINNDNDNDSDAITSLKTRTTSGVGFGNFEGNIDDMNDTNDSFSSSSTFNRRISSRGVDVDTNTRFPASKAQELSDIELVQNMFNDIDDLISVNPSSSSSPSSSTTRKSSKRTIEMSEEESLLDNNNTPSYQGDDRDELGALITDDDDEYELLSQTEIDDENTDMFIDPNSEYSLTTNNALKSISKLPLITHSSDDDDDYDVSIPSSDSDSSTIDFDKIFEGIKSTSTSPSSITQNRASRIHNKYKQKFSESIDDDIIFKPNAEDDKSKDINSTLEPNTTSGLSKLSDIIRNKKNEEFTIDSKNSTSSTSNTKTSKLKEQKKIEEENENTVATTLKNLLDKDLQEFLNEMNE